MGNSLRRNTAFDLTQSKFIAPQSRLDANRWLSFATFGAGTPETDISASTKSSIVPLAGATDDATVLMSQGYATYVTNQFNDTTIPLIYGLTKTDSDVFGDNTFGDPQHHIHAWWYTQALHGTAQIKLKMAYALSQIFVVNGSGNSTDSYNKYYEILVRATVSNNTSTYRQMLEDITYSSAMAIMLTYNGNRKANASTNSRPDENYAREILQLFSIGLKQLNLDGSSILDANGIELETYRPSDIPEVAKIFTGLSTDNYASTSPNTGPCTQETYYENRHELGSKVFFAYPNASAVTFPPLADEYKAVETPPNNAGYIISGVTANTFVVTRLSFTNEARSNVTIRYGLTPNIGDAKVTANIAFNSTLATVTKTAHGLTNGTRVYILSSLQESIKFALDYIFNHPNCGPFLAKALIKFFVTSNPTPGFVARVASKFNNNGSGVRGDLSALVKAILLDKEAIIPYGINTNSHGKYTTLIDRYVRIGRAFRSDMMHCAFNNSNQINTFPEYRLKNFVALPTFFTIPRSYKDYCACAIYYSGTIQPTESPGVFNFFRPGYIPPASTFGNLNKTAPEMQINTVENQIVWVNAISALCETETATTDNQDFLDPHGNIDRLYGFDFVPDAAGFTVTVGGGSDSFITISGNTTTNILTDTGGQLQVSLRRRSDGLLFRGYYNRPTGTGTKTFQIHIYPDGGNVIAVGDVLDLSQLGIFGNSGFPSRSVIGGGGDKGEQSTHPMIILFHKVANLLPNTVTAPTLAECNVAIDYLESILMTRPITAPIRALMVTVAQATTVANTPKFTGDATFTNNWLNVIVGHAQKRARLMTGILLASPEFSAIR